MNWFRQVYENHHHQWQAVREAVLSCLPSFGHRRKLKKLQEEFFAVPPLPPIQFMEAPLGDRLQSARQEMSDFLKEEDSVTDEEHRYLLMQLFFRGPMDKVREEVREVLGTVHVEESIQTLPVWDIGCGRGELLEVLNEAGFNAVGIDTSALMVKKLSELNMKVRHGDAIEELRTAADDSLCGVTAFHVIEHMPFHAVTELLELSYQKLAPGGFLLLETPNPFCFESLSFFYTDETHVRPIQPYQLAFAVETAGFTDTRLHFTAPVPAKRKQDRNYGWMRLYQNHGIVAKKPLASQAAIGKAA